jgi:hypothetical protein
MKYLLYCSLLVFSASSILGSPSAPIISTERSYTVPQQVNPDFIKDGPSQLKKAYKKYNIGGGTLAPVVKTSTNVVKTSGSVVATPEVYDSQYFCPVSIDGQTLHVSFDSGSSDL